MYVGLFTYVFGVFMGWPAGRPGHSRLRVGVVVWSFVCCDCYALLLFSCPLFVVVCISCCVVLFVVVCSCVLVLRVYSCCNINKHMNFINFNIDSNFKFVVNCHIKSQYMLINLTPNTTS